MFIVLRYRGDLINDSSMLNVMRLINSRGGILMKNQIITILVFCFITLFSGVSAASPYFDVPSNHWAADAITVLKSEGYPMGYGDNTFRGDRSITRYELAGMMAQLLKQKTGIAVSKNSNPFTDLPNNHYFYNAVTTLASRGIISGYGDGTFRGDKTITRYEMALSVAKLLASVGTLDSSSIGGNPFVDVPSNHWAYDSLMALAAKGIVNSYGDARFNGDRNATRYEAAVMIAKAAVSD